MRALAFGLLLSLFPARAAEPPDVAWRQGVNLRLGPDNKGKLWLTSTTEVTQTYLTPRSLRATRFSFPEQYYAKVSGRRAWIRGKELGEDVFGFSYPQDQDVFMSSAKLHQVEFPKDLKVGEVVGFSYMETFLDLAFTPFYRVTDEGCTESFVLTVDHPTDVVVEFETFAPQGALPKIQHPSPTQTVYLLTNLPRLERRTGYAWNGLHAMVFPHFSRGGKSLLPSSPETFAAWYKSLLHAVPEPSETLERTAREVTASAVTPRAKAKALFDFVKQNIRYAADERNLGAIVPRPPAEVLARTYGDCKDKAYLLQALGRTVGIDLPMVLIDTRGVPGLPMLNVGLFNHCISAFEDEGKWIFMDPTQSLLEFGSLPSQDIGCEALLLSQLPKRLITPAQVAKPTLEVRIQADLSKLRTGRAVVTFRNDFQAFARASLRDLRPLEWENRLSNLVNSRFSKLSLDDFRLDRDDPDGMTFTADANLESFIVASPTRRYIPQAPFRSVDPDLVSRKEDPLALHPETLPWMRLQIQVAGEGWASPASEWRASGGELAFALATSDGKLGFSYELRQEFRAADGPGRESLLTFFSDLLKRRKTLFTLDRSQL